MIDPLYSLALATGFLGSAHCIGMCGGLVSAFSLSLANKKTLLFQILYNLGRITTYSIIGLIVGLLGSVLAYTNIFYGVMKFALLASDIFIIIVGLGTAGMFKNINVMRLDFPGPTKALSKLTAAFLRSPSPLAAMPLGLIMGFLPCGFAYTVAITAAQSASPYKGALIMLFFGLGTSPALLLVGSTTQWISKNFRQWMLRFAGVMVAFMGIYNLMQHLNLLGWTLSGPVRFLCG